MRGRQLTRFNLRPPLPPGEEAARALVGIMPTIISPVKTNAGMVQNKHILNSNSKGSHGPESSEEA